MRSKEEIEEAIIKYKEIRDKMVIKNNKIKIEIIDQRLLTLNWVLESD